MPHRLLAAGLIVAFLFCYMEWGQGRSAFVYHAVYEIFRTGTFLQSVSHPLVFTSLGGILALLYSAARETPSRKITRSGILLLSPMVFLVMLAGALGGGVKMIASAVPFVIIAVALWRR